MKRDTIQMQMIDFIKTNQITKPVYRKLKSRENAKRFRINSINRAVPVRAEGDEIRYNLIIPTMRRTRVFAGISSALNFFLKLAGDEAKCRVIVISNEMYTEKTTYLPEGFQNDRKAGRSLWFMNDGRELEVMKNDIFIYTSWKTAVSFMPVAKWQREEFGIGDRKAVYLIQDYEPGFFPWSTEYTLAESTYLTDPDKTIAVFNSKELYDYFQIHHYTFAHSTYFTPNLNPTLSTYLQEYEKKSRGKQIKKRDKRVLIYGRPSEHRNAFELIRYSLERWSEEYPGANEWEIVSLGEGFEDIPLSNNIIRSYGKVSLEQYAKYMFTSYAGISLMVSPHPSYPPLEMSTFGVRTITNQYENKDLSYFNENIISLRACSPDNIVKALSDICGEYETAEPRIVMDRAYIAGDSFSQTAEEIRTYLSEMLLNE